MRRDTRQPDKVMLSRGERRRLLTMELDLLQAEPPSVRVRQRVRLAAALAGSAWRRSLPPERSWKAGVLIVMVGLAATLSTVSTSVLAAVAGAVLTGCGLTLVSARLREVVASRTGLVGDHR